MTMTGVEPDHQQHVSASVMGDDNAFLTRHSRCSSSSMEEVEEGGQQSSQQQEAGAEQLTYSRMAHLLAVYQNMVLDSKRIISRLKRQKDAQVQAVINQLLLLEAHLRREQKGIVGQLAQRDHVISTQRQEIDRLRRDNRRVINKLKKFNEVCTDAGGDVGRLEQKVKISRVEPSEERTLSSRKGHSQSLSGSPSSCKSSSGMIRVATSVSELINCSNGTSFFKPQQVLHHTSIRSTNRQPTETVNPNEASVRATTDRVFHKPPIAEKPRVASRVPRGQQSSRNNNQKGQHLVRSYGGKQCTIVSTISRLLEEKSDTTTTGGSCSSEPSSPEATLKPTTPRVIRLARKFEGLNSQNLAPYANNSSSESSPELVRQDDRNSKSFVMDEYEVTRGYNSESVSEHEYENVRVLTQGSDVSPSTKPVKQVEGEEEDNYVILRAVKENADAGNWVDIPEDQHIYSNVEFASGLLVKDLEDEEEDPIINLEDDDKLEQNSTSSGHGGANGEEGKVLETNLDSLDSSADDDNLLSESLRAAMNVPRSRHNINFFIESNGDHMTENFEEFTLDSLELEGDHEDEDRGKGKENLPISEQRRCGDGAETKLESKNKEESKLDLSVNSGSASIVMMGSGQYEKFLEATGLSQKSLLTPTRMFSNHRSVLKPRDVKHRNKLRAAFTTLSTLEETPSSGGGYRYWTNPYL
ncbi:serine-rich adhesin for platelets-like [Procambarus clarkii]|uniref:serine-rich adhesin for platelets-like n=1 Tax=Procambarus clarkii TaxID=6728 RepID=UPI0037445103